jgi:predicted metal-dependent enzyme (double-stranded beta helix superfamily)
MFTKERFIEDCLACLRETNAQAAVQELVSRTMRSPGEIEAVLGTPSDAGLGTVYRSDELTVLNVVWAPKMALYPHDHRMWAVIGIYGGQEDNRFYRRRPEGVGLEQVNGRSLAEEDCMSLGSNVIHAVTNPRRAYTGAIHVYGGDFFAAERSEWPSPEAAEQPWSVDRALRAFADANEKAKEILAQG